MRRLSPQRRADLFLYGPLLGLLAPLSPAAAAEPVPTEAVAGIVSLFEKYPVVALGEDHNLREFGDLYIRLVRDPRFQAVVNDIVVEFAGGNTQPLLDRYLLECEDVPRAELRKVWRDIWKVYAFECPIYAEWLAAIREVNKKLPKAKRLRVLAGDWPIDWSKVTTHREHAAMGSNNRSFARVVNEEVLTKKRKCLFVAGWTHIAKNGDNRETYASGEGGIPGNHNATTLIEKAHPGSVVVIFPFLRGSVRDFQSVKAKLADWKKPSLLYPLKGSSLGAEAGLGRPPDRLDRLGDALLYLGPSLTTLPNWPDKIDKAYYDELQRRAMIRWGHTRFVEKIPHEDR